VAEPVYLGAAVQPQPYIAIADTPLDKRQIVDQGEGGRACIAALGAGANAGWAARSEACESSPVAAWDDCKSRVAV
jgi:hypothetical protein